MHPIHTIIVDVIEGVHKYPLSPQEMEVTENKLISVHDDPFRRTAETPGTILGMNTAFMELHQPKKVDYRVEDFRRLLTRRFS